MRSRRPRVVDEIRHALWFFETTLLDVAPDVLAEYRGRLPAAPVPFRFGLVGRGRPGRQSRGGAAHRGRVARARPPAGAHALPRRGAPARARDGQLDPHGAGERRAAASIERDEGELAAFALEIGDQNFDEPYRRKLSFVGKRLENLLERNDEPATPAPTSCSPSSS